MALDYLPATVREAPAASSSMPAHSSALIGRRGGAPDLVMRAFVDDRIKMVARPLLVAGARAGASAPEARALRRRADREFVERIRRHATLIDDLVEQPALTRDRKDDDLALWTLRIIALVAPSVPLLGVSALARFDELHRQVRVDLRDPGHGTESSGDERLVRVQVGRANASPNIRRTSITSSTATTSASTRSTVPRSLCVRSKLTRTSKAWPIASGSSNAA
jgi:hypothetical protein